MTSEVSWDKLPSSFFGLFLIVHLVVFSGIFYFWLNNLSSNCSSLPSKFLPASICGIIIGAVMFYHVDPYYNNIKKNKAIYKGFWRQPLANHIMPQPEKPAEPILNYKVCVTVVLVIYVISNVISYIFI